MRHADYVLAVRAVVEADLGIPVTANCTEPPSHWSLRTESHSVSHGALQHGRDPVEECAANITRAFRLALACDADRLDDWEAFDLERMAALGPARVA